MNYFEIVARPSTEHKPASSPRFSSSKRDESTSGAGGSGRSTLFGIPSKPASSPQSQHGTIERDDRKKESKKRNILEVFKKTTSNFKSDHEKSDTKTKQQGQNHHILDKTELEYLEELKVCNICTYNELIIDILKHYYLCNWTEIKNSRAS